MLDVQIWELLSYVVTVVGLPVAIVIFSIEQRKQRTNGEDEIQQLLSDSYTDFLKVVIGNADLRLLSGPAALEYSAEQRERIVALYAMLISIFERAYIMAYVPDSAGRRVRYWRTWEDTMIEWCEREDFRAALPSLLVGEDEEFADHMQGLARAIESGKELQPRRVG